ncbi:MAG TPA: hypothetical protein VFX43_17950 [Chitinophagaceae bacterium]|nr:hypothetical protein [Chitinophagaceae bacterium]
MPENLEKAILHYFHSIILIMRVPHTCSYGKGIEKVIQGLLTAPVVLPASLQDMV